MTVWSSGTSTPRFDVNVRVRLISVASLTAPLIVFGLVHLMLIQINLVPGAMWDVTVPYHEWANEWFEHGRLVGIDQPWVYPVLALVPMLMARLAGDQSYATAWLILVTALDLIVFVPLLLRSRRAAWWWIVFTACLGPIALGRIDAVALPLAIAGVLLLARRPTVAAALLALGAWIKIWPAALLIALLTNARGRLRVLIAVGTTSAFIIATALALGSGFNVFSAGTAQADRGVQIEAPVALPWMWLAHFRPDRASTFFNSQILTYEVSGKGTHFAATIMNPALFLVVALLAALALRARKNGKDSATVTAVSALGLVAALISFNKVGSPQYITWFAAPMIFGILVDARRFRWPAVTLLLVALLTQNVFPLDYDNIIKVSTSALALMTIRNILELGLLAWAVKQLLEDTPAYARLAVHSSRLRRRGSRLVRMALDASPKPR